MITVCLGTWCRSAGRFFVCERIYRKGYVWTPFCKIRRRDIAGKGKHDISKNSC